MEQDFGKLITDYQHGSQDAAEKLYRHFHRLVVKLSYCNNRTVKNEDLENELWCCFFEVTKKFDALDAKRYPGFIRSSLRLRRKAYLRHITEIQSNEVSDVTASEEPLYECEHVDLEVGEWSWLEKKLGFTKRQKDIVLMIRAGFSCREIRKKLGISQQGLYKHRQNIKAKIESAPEVYEFLLENRL